MKKGLSALGFLGGLGLIVALFFVSFTIYAQNAQDFNEGLGFISECGDSLMYQAVGVPEDGYPAALCFENNECEEYKPAQDASCDMEDFTEVGFSSTPNDAGNCALAPDTNFKWVYGGKGGCADTTVCCIRSTKAGERASN